MPTRGLQVYDVKVYGAKGDGTTNDQAAIQSAVSAASTAGGEIVFFPQGTYKVNTTITMAQDVLFRGNGPGASVVKAGAASIDVFSMVTTPTQVNFGIQDLGIDGGGFTGVRAIRLDSTSSTPSTWVIVGITLVNLYISNCNVGVYTRLVTNIFINRVVCSVVTTAFQNIQAGQCAYVECFAENGSGVGFSITGDTQGTHFGEGISLTGCETNAQAIGCTITTQAWGVMVGCSFSSTSTGSPLQINTCNNWQIVGCQFAPGSAAYPCAWVEVSATPSTNISFADCFFALGTYGLLHAGTFGSITGCTFTDNSNVDINLVGNKLAVSGCVCQSAGSSGDSIAESGSPSPDYNALTGNICHQLISLAGAHSVATGNIQSYP